VKTSRVDAGAPMATWRATLFQGSAAQARSQWKRVAEMTQMQWNDSEPSSLSAEGALERIDNQGSSSATNDESVTEDAGSISAQRRKQIFRGALKVIAKKGYGAATIREIAAAAKLPIPTMYQYIKSKEDILYMITSGCMEDLMDVFQENLSTKKATEERLTRAISAYVDYIEINRRYINLVYRETRSLSRDNREKIFAIERQFTGFWRKILEDGQASGEIDVSDANLTANFIYFLCTVWALRYWSIGQYSPNVIKRELTEFILRGLGLRSGRAVS
jgi:AcrR family transcriptional regulator